MAFTEDGVTDPTSFTGMSLSLASAISLNISIKSSYYLQGKIEARHSRQAQSL